MDEPRYDEATKTYTTGHSYDGIEELNTPLPRWWLWTLYMTIVWAVIYSIAYPAWPLVSSATAGFLGYSTRAEVATEIARVDAANSDLNTQLAAVDLTALKDNEPLHQFAVASGASVCRCWSQSATSTFSPQRRDIAFSGISIPPFSNSFFQCF